ncbi:uncharacterized protein N7477_000190 [Penicillium maclennaniae]|uniref:uncharacterized protein n=1 Tax=Penicillium maclennaniae TaxID=1343394 RepID=UPI0025406F77|nr:uncharacterized protein N7477_000190 [Penicillium maclennaniae]KAJ5683845.1 hypothetical protein N7477_000190 [Penicillium maclennaniae]
MIRNSTWINWITWITEELQMVARDIEKAGIVFVIQVFVTKFPGLSIALGRPDWDNLFQHALLGAQGESAIGVCGPLTLSIEARSKVVALNRDGHRGLYLHVESFS